MLLISLIKAPSRCSQTEIICSKHMTSTSARNICESCISQFGYVVGLMRFTEPSPDWARNYSFECDGVINYHDSKTPCSLYKKLYSRGKIITTAFT